MAYWIDESSLSNVYGSSRQLDFYCDTAADIANLPTHTKEGVPQGDTVTHKKVDKGSSCLCIADSSLYMLNSEDEWIKM